MTTRGATLYERAKQLIDQVTEALEGIKGHTVYLTVFVDDPEEIDAIAKLLSPADDFRIAKHVNVPDRRTFITLDWGWKDPHRSRVALNHSRPMMAADKDLSRFPEGAPWPEDLA